jgi:hypothetical protein
MTLRIVAGLLAIAVLTARAEEEAGGVGGVGVTAKVGTLGYGGDLTLGLGSRVNVRGGYNQMDYEGTRHFEDADITGELRWQTIPILLDVHPFGGGFRLSAGPVVNNNELILSATANKTVKLNDEEYEVARLDGSVTFDENSWYFGFGYGNAVGRDGRWHFSCDFGVMYHGEPQINATATASDPEVQDALNSALDTELEKWRDDASQFRYYPVIAFGVSFRF